MVMVMVMVMVSKAIHIYTIEHLRQSLRSKCSGLIIPDTVLGGTVATMTRGVQ